MTPTEVISGYRSPTTNRTLRKASNGVAKQSLHMQGKAIDVRLTSLDTASLRDLATKLKLGGVGYYRKSDFVHLDTGRFRTWWQPARRPPFAYWGRPGRPVLSAFKRKTFSLTCGPIIYRAVVLRVTGKRSLRISIPLQARHRKSGRRSRRWSY